MAKYPRLRMFAGPNGAGKSTMKTMVSPKLLDLYINPDELEKDARAQGCFDSAPFAITAGSEEISAFFRAHPLMRKSGLLPEVEKLRFCENKIECEDVVINSYFAAVWADFVRRKLLEKGASFSFETVMSSPDKVQLLERARELRYHTYLYYVATADPEINVSRVRLRVAQGGHDVPADKIEQRYYRSLDLLFAVIRHSNRAYIFDNSRSDLRWLAEFAANEKWEAKVNHLPQWFKVAVLDKIGSID